MSLLARQLYFEAVKSGDELPPLVKAPIDRLQIARYAGASGEFNPLSLDEIRARNAGFPSVIVPGMLAMGFAGELVVDWLRGARLRRFSARFVKMIWPGDVLTCRGRVAERRFGEPGSYFVDIDLSVENQRGELVLRGQVTAQLYYGAEDDARQRAGQPPLVVTAADEAERLAKLHPPPRKPSPPPAKAAPPQKPAAPQKAAPLAKAGAPQKAAIPAEKPQVPAKAPAPPRPAAASKAPAPRPAPARSGAAPRPAPKPAGKDARPPAPRGAKGASVAASQRGRPAPPAKAKAKARAAARKPARSVASSKPAARARSAPGKKPLARKRR